MRRPRSIGTLDAAGIESAKALAGPYRPQRHGYGCTLTAGLWVETLTKPAIQGQVDKAHGRSVWIKPWDGSPVVKVDVQSVRAIPEDFHLPMGRCPC